MSLNSKEQKKRYRKKLQKIAKYKEKYFRRIKSPVPICNDDSIDNYVKHLFYTLSQEGIHYKSKFRSKLFLSIASAMSAYTKERKNIERQEFIKYKNNTRNLLTEGRTAIHTKNNLVNKLLDLRIELRIKKDYETADKIRNMLISEDIEIWDK